MSEESAYNIDKRKVQASFDQSATRYDEVAYLQREVGNRLVERLEAIRFSPELILDIGAGTGDNSKALRAFYPKASVITTDISTAMLHQARNKGSRLDRWRGKQTFACADMEQLPFADGSIDMIFSNLSVQWSQDLQAMFAECRRVLRPGGMLMYTTLGPDTLKELRASWQQVDDAVHVNAFMDMHDIGDAMMRAQLSEPVMDMEYFTLTYHEASQLMRELKVLGAHNINAGRPKALMGKQRLHKMYAAYEAYRREGLLPATYEVVYGHAWAPEHGIQQQQQGDVTTISLQQ
ncbi:MAG: malonyl-ACP O-methyltransferase BioC, partial [Gammaproteobacteria bacterium]|nr:malonyl-ACP O-methyltransferase BioC [Gammaproteobacteria bacterium]